MSDSEDELNFCMYGNLLPPFEEDEIPSKKPLNIEDQVARDAHGRRRFHGAFTGGFSAGFCNTVGSLEGWAPKSFKSSRSEKAGSQTQRPEDFMDDEDRAVFGFAPETTITTKDFNSVQKSRKRTHQFETGPIPGQCVLKLLLEPAKETIGVKLLKQMGWRPGQGVGPRMTGKQKREFRRKRNLEVSDSDSDDDKVTFAPDDFDEYVCKPKENTFGMGYIGLSTASILGSKNKSGSFTMIDHKNKKISIQGQAFGVGAFEEDDEDIYAKEDMSSYDFELGSTKSNKALTYQNNVLKNFVKSSTPITVLKFYPPPVLPKDYVFEHRSRRTRFEPLSQVKRSELQKFNTKSTNLNSEERSVLLEEPTVKPIEVKSSLVPSEGPKIIQHKLMTTNKFVSSSSSGEFKPFAIDPEKQERYEKYVELCKSGELDKFEDVQPITLNEWERDRERYEFEQAYLMFKPKRGLVFDRFVEAEQHEDVNNVLEVSDIQNAAKLKMFGKLTREELQWFPNSLLYKRFNIAEPANSIPSGSIQKKKTFKKSNIFDFINAASKNDTPKPVETTLEPVEIPKNRVLPKRDLGIEIIDDTIVTAMEIPIPVTKSPEPPEPPPMNKVKPIETINESHPESSNEPPMKPIAVVKEDEVLHTETKIDLYKAIFLSSDEESEEEDKQETTTFKDTLIAEIGDTSTPKEPEVNRNSEETKTSEIIVPKPTGIFANIDFKAINQKHVFKPKAKTEEPKIEKPEKAKAEEPVDPSIYGPRLPSTVIASMTTKLKDSESSSSSEDEWVEKKVHKKHKKEKKSKHKHKKKKESHRKHKKSKRKKSKE